MEPWQCQIGLSQLKNNLAQVYLTNSGAIAQTEKLKKIIILTIGQLEPIKLRVSGAIVVLSKHKL
jgi:hypothetical protein